MSGVRRSLSWIWTGLIVVLVVVMAALVGREFEGPELVLSILFVASIVVMTALGSVVTARRPGNRIGWLLHVIAVSLLLTIWADTVIGDAGGGPSDSPGTVDLVAAIVSPAAGVTAMYSIGLLLYLFPTGHFLTRRWIWAGWLGGILVPLTWIISVFAVEVGDVWSDEPWVISNPIGFLPVEWLDLVGSAVPMVLLGVLVGGVASMIIRFRRSDLVVRTQIKWVLFAAVLTLVSGPFAFAELGLVSNLLTLVVLNAIPVSVAIAVARYKLFEIDRLISRSISYAIVVLLLGAVFAAGAVWLPTQLPGDQPPLFVAATTLAVAALFNPVRKRVQRGVDRKFNRSRYQASRVAEEFLARLQGTNTVEHLEDAWITTVNAHFQPSASGLWLREGIRSEER